MSGMVLTWATPVLAATTIFQWLFQSRLGVVNWLLVTLGFDSFKDYTWFADGNSTFASWSRWWSGSRCRSPR